MELTTSMPELSRISILFVSLTVEVDGLAANFILPSDRSNGFPISETQFDFVYLLWGKGRFPTAPVVCVTLSGKEDAFPLPYI